MRKIFVFFMALIGLGLMLGGCTHYVKYIPSRLDLKPPKKVTQIKGVVSARVVDARKDKKHIWAAFLKKGYLPEKDFIKGSNNIVKRALENAGYEVTKNSETKVNVKILDAKQHNGAFLMHRKTAFLVTVDKKNICVLRQKIQKSKPILFGWGYQNAADDVFEQMYHVLVNFFMTKKFEKAVNKNR